MHTHTHTRTHTHTQAVMMSVNPLTASTKVSPTEGSRGTGAGGVGKENDVGRGRSGRQFVRGQSGRQLRQFGSVIENDNVRNTR